jgi:mannose-1-phosphate guanylyltransferase / phosphomannomutase
MRDQIMNYVGDGSKLGQRITYVIKPDEFQSGTAGSLKLVEHMLNDTFLVAQSDTLSEIPLTEAVSLHRTTNAHATVVLTSVENPSAFGVAMIDEGKAITEFQEKPSQKEARGNLVSTGFYVMEPDSLDYIMDAKWDFAKDLFPSLLNLRKKLYGFASDSFWADIGSLDGYLTGVRWALEKATPHYPATTELPNHVSIDSEAHVGEHPQIIGPAVIENEVIVDDNAKIQQYSVLGKNVRIASGTVIGRSVIMERASIGRNCVILDSVIGQSATLQDNVTMEGTIIGPGCLIKERAKFLNGSRVWPKVQIGMDQVVNGIVAAPIEKAFYFYTGPGQYTGLLATTMRDFIEELGKAPIDSIEFHAKNRDFERWARNVLASNELADGIEDLRRMTVMGEELRSGLIEVTKKWADKIES